MSNTDNRTYAEHGWSVGYRVLMGPKYAAFGKAVYVARCLCGWERECEEEPTAARLAAAHAGANDKPPEPLTRFRGPRQTERLFEP